MPCCCCCCSSCPFICEGKVALSKLGGLQIPFYNRKTSITYLWILPYDLIPNYFTLITTPKLIWFHVGCLGPVTFSVPFKFPLELNRTIFGLEGKHSTGIFIKAYTQKKMTLSQRQIFVTLTIAPCFYTDNNRICWKHNHFLLLSLFFSPSPFL